MVECATFRAFRVIVGSWDSCHRAIVLWWVHVNCPGSASEKKSVLYKKSKQTKINLHKILFPKSKDLILGYCKFFMAENAIVSL